MEKIGADIRTDAQAAIGRLRELFPRFAGVLLSQFAAANVKGKQLPEWRQKQIEAFIAMLGITAVGLERSYREKHIAALGWAGRNVLELSVWIDYCLLSENNARRFYEDSLRDLHGLSRAMARSIKVATGKEAPELATKIAELEKFARSTTSIEEFKDDFMQVAVAADELGRREEFVSATKVLHKFAHPTAWMVHTVLSVDVDEEYRALFLTEGAMLCINSLIAIRTFVRTIYTEVAKGAAD
jgi:hypothetical protein